MAIQNWVFSGEVDNVMGPAMGGTVWFGFRLDAAWLDRSNRCQRLSPPLSTTTITRRGPR